MRARFPQRRRIVGPKYEAQKFVIEPPPELPRTIQLPAWKKALPWLFGAVIIGMIVMMLVMGIRQMNPMYLFMMGIMGVSLFSSLESRGNNSEMSTPEVDSERAEYLRYLSGKGEDLRKAAAAQKSSAEWSHPDPEVLEAVLDEPRQWERGASDPDYLHIRIGRDEVKLAAQVKVKPVDSELDLEPVAKTTLQHLRAVQQSIPHCPKAIDVASYGMIGVYGDRPLFRATVRAWVAQLVCWHTPNDTALAVVASDLEGKWEWAKWLPHTESNEIDGAGPARFLGTSLRDVEAMLDPMLKERAKTIDDKGTVDPGAVSKSNKHVVVVIDDPAAPSAVVRRIASRDGVTVIAYRDGAGPDRDYATHPRELLLHVQHNAGAVQMDNWHNFGWRTFCAEPDVLDAPVLRHLARQLCKWDSAPIGRQDAESTAAQNFLSLLGIRNAAKLDVNALWTPRMLPVGTNEPVDLENLLKVPIGLQPSGAPLILDLKDEADGGNGPHGLMIGMTGSGKSTQLAALAAGLFATHSPDVVQAILVDFKDGAGFDAFTDYPHVVAVVTNMEEKKSLVDRFGDTLLGLLDLRGRIFHEAGNQIKGAAFQGLREYNQARATPAGAHLPPVPWMFVFVDEFSLMLMEHRDMAEVFEVVTRKGRSQGVSLLFSSQTLDEGVIKKIPDNTQYRIGLKVASDATSRRVIGTADAYHIPDGKNVKGTGYFVRAPGAEPVKYRGFMLPSRYEPPKTINRRVINAKPRARVFTAGRVAPDADTVIEEEIAAESVIEGPPRSLVLTLGPQLTAAYGKRPPQLWSPPLDDPIPLDALLRQANAAAPRSGGPWWPVGEIDRPRQLSHGLLSYGVDDGNISILGMRNAELSLVAQTFILAAASRYSPTEVGFFALSYGGTALASLKDLPHVGAIGGKDRTELNLRILGDLDSVVGRRRRMFRELDVGSIDEYRRRRAAGDSGLDDGYPTDIFVIVDGWENFSEDNTSLLAPKNPAIKNIERLIGAGHGIHVMITAADWIKLGLTIQNQINVKYELKLANPGSSQVRARLEDKMVRPQDRIPADEPGRGINATGDVIRFGVGRVDGKPTMDDLDVKVRETVAALADRYGDARPVPRPRLLPNLVPLDKLPQKLGDEKHVLGLRGRDLRPMVVDFAEDPLLAVYGDDRHGKTTFITNLARSVVANRADAGEALVVLLDKSRRLSSFVTRHLTEEDPTDPSKPCDYYETDFASMARRLGVLAHMLSTRTPPADLGWKQKETWAFEGPLIYLIVDDVDAIPASVTVHAPVTAGGPPTAGVGQMVDMWRPMLGHIANARDIGLRIIMTHRATSSGVAELTPSLLPGQFKAQNATRIMLSAKTTEDKIGGVKFEQGLPPGRGYVISANENNGGYVQLAGPADGM